MGSAVLSLLGSTVCYLLSSGWLSLSLQNLCFDGNLSMSKTSGKSVMSPDLLLLLLLLLLKKKKEVYRPACLGRNSPSQDSFDHFVCLGSVVLLSGLSCLQGKVQDGWTLKTCGGHC